STSLRDALAFAQYKCPMPNTSLREAAPTTYLGLLRLARVQVARHKCESTSAPCPMLKLNNHPQKLATIQWCKRYI
ncbi:hypothetical protein, partial [uncultured Nostoc sp.]|uniref:hypothetical protein n=1 Tax=uncultured Nostoc sp. TaxID=340711 RepID=UPI0035C9CB29